MVKKQINFYDLLLSILRDKDKKYVIHMFSDTIWKATNIRLDICNIEQYERSKTLKFTFGRNTDAVRISFTIKENIISTPNFNSDGKKVSGTSIIPDLLYDKLISMERQYKIEKALKED